MEVDSGATSARRTVRVDAPAKVNLYLHLLGRRADGLHRLDSLIVFAGVGDSVTVEAAPDLTLAVDGPFADRLPSDDDNLVLRAARFLAEAFGSDNRTGATIRLTKRLPVAAGVGGGSADAAATLLALMRLWKIRPGEKQLDRIALMLGADLPVCLAGSPCFVGGIGEELAPVPPLPPAHLVLVNPGVPLPTAAVFQARSGPFSEAARFAEAPADAAALAALLAARGNDLTVAACGLAPAVAAMLAALDATPGCLLA
uniref:4-(cytidine 5'-diphospho)-2-C-methyl-D-erythritol kinase n=1 Tax=Virgifigura deserti TaxID=2268457 RepID=UPI000E667EDB